MSKEMTPKEELKIGDTVTIDFGNYGVIGEIVSISEIDNEYEIVYHTLTTDFFPIEHLALTVKPLQIINQALTELEELKRDVKRYFELDYQDDDGMDDVDAIEYTRLYIKLSKVGIEE